MVKRSAIGIALLLVALFLIDLGSSFFVPRGCLVEKVIEIKSGQNPQQRAADNACAYKGGLVTQGVIFISELKPETWTAVSTVVIAVFTTILGLFTISLARSTRIAAEHIPNVEGPYVFVGEPNGSWLINRGDDYGNPRIPPAVTLHFINYGKTPAIIKERRVEIVLTDSLPGKPTFTYSVAATGDIVLGPGLQTKPINFAMKRSLTDTEFDEIENGKKSFFLIGYLRYSDVFGRVHTHGFGMRYRPEQSAFTLNGAGGIAYNYRKTESE